MIRNLQQIAKSQNFVLQITAVLKIQIHIKLREMVFLLHYLFLEKALRNALNVDIEPTINTTNFNINIP